MGALSWKEVRTWDNVCPHCLSLLNETGQVYIVGGCATPEVYSPESETLHVHAWSLDGKRFHAVLNLCVGKKTAQIILCEAFKPRVQTQ